MRPYLYANVLLVPAFVFVALITEGWQTFLAPLVFFTLIPLGELLAPGSEENLGPDEERTVGQKKIYDLLVYSMVPIQWALMAFFLWRLSTATLSWVEVLGMSASMAMACGVLGINVGHELGHRRKKSEQIMAKALLSSSLYAHFFIEHNRGHHSRVATDDDPATARRGETIYAYIPRSMVGGLLSAWHLENDRLRKRGERVLSWSNEMVRLTVFQGAFCSRH
jgi:alkane 1-monooxygenase